MRNMSNEFRPVAFNPGLIVVALSQWDAEREILFTIGSLQKCEDITM